MPSLDCGVVTVATSQQKITVGGQNQYVTIKAYKENTNDVWIGNKSETTVKETSYPLSKGEVITVPIGDIGLFWCIGSAGDKLYFIGVGR